MTKEIVIKNTYDNIFNKVAMILTMLLGLFYMLNVSETIILVVGVIFVFVLLLLPSRESIKYLMFILCANEMITFGRTSLTMIFVSVFSVVNCFFSLKKIKINVGILFSTLLLLLICVASYFVIGSTNPLLSTIKHIFFLYYTSVVLSESRGEWNRLYINVFQYISMGILYFGFISILINGLPLLTERFTFSSEVTVNYIAIVCAISVVNLLYSALALKDKSRTNAFLILGCVFVGILTQSRSFILATAIGVILLCLFTSSFTKRLEFIVITMVCVAVMAVVVTNIPTLSSRINVVLDRIINPYGNDISNGRYDLWSLTISSMTENRDFFWLGAGDYNRIGASFGNRVLVAHNLFLETWVMYGLIGCAILIMLYVLFIKRYIFIAAKRKIKLLSFVPLIVMTSCLLYSHHFIGRSMSIVFALSFLPMVLDIEQVEGKKI